MSSKIEVKDLLKIDFGDHDRKLQSVLRASFGALDQALPTRPLWNAQFFGLDNSKLFKSLSDDQQNEITEKLSRHLLTESYAIEKIGMGFTAKMSLLADRLEERMLYSSFAFDEASHFYQISAYLDDVPKNLDASPFLSFLASLIENEDRDVLVVVIQVMLEGWGMSHYRKMLESAADSGFQTMMRKILKDEARHHGSGLAILSKADLSESQKRRVSEIMSHMVEMVRMGPQSTVQITEQVAGHLTKAQKIRLFEDLGGTAHASERLSILRDLIPTECLFLMNDLESHQRFVPYSPTQCADIQV